MGPQPHVQTQEAIQAFALDLAVALPAAFALGTCLGAGFGLAFGLWVSGTLDSRFLWDRS